jgi:HAE1 family hydrophobic/amphiphilic exporter-1
MWLTRVFLERWPLTIVLIALTTLFGVVSAKSLIVQRLPNTDQPTVGMRLTYSGASTTEIRDTIARPVEDQISGSQDLLHVDTAVQTGSATIASYFALGSPSDTDLTNVIEAFNAAKSQLPSDLVNPVIRIYDPNAATVVSIGLSSRSMTTSALAALANGQIGPAIEQLGGVSNVLVAGNVQAAYNVTVDPNALAGYGLTLTDIINTLSGNNLRAPGGIAYQPGRETQIDVRGDIDSPAAVAGLSVSSTSGGSTGGGNAPTLYGPSPYTGSLYGWTRPSQGVNIGDVSRVEDASVPVRNFAYINGIPGIELQVSKTSDASEISVSDTVIKALPALQQQFPSVKFRVDYVQSNYSRQQVEGVIRTLIEGVVLTAVLMVLFLQSWRNAVVVMIAIPTSLCVALLAMRIFNFSLDTISLLAMTLVIGVLIDDSTVVLENVTRHHENGEEPLEAALNGRGEIGTAAIVITLVDVVVFLPIAFIGGPVGVQLAEFAVVVTVSTLTSLFVSFTITPSLAGIWALKSNWKPWKPIRAFDHGFEWLRTRYHERLLPAAMKTPWPILITAAVLTVLALSAIPLGIVGEDYIPAADQGEIYYTLTFAPGTPLEHTQAVLNRIQREVVKFPDLETEVTNAGGFNSPYGGFLLEGNVGQINIFLNEKRKQSTNYYLQQMLELGRKFAPDGISLAKPASDPTQGGPRQPIDELVSLPDGSDPSQYAIKVAQALRAAKGAINVNDSAEQDLPQVSVEFDRGMARALGVSIGTASSAIRAAFGGDVATELESPNGLVQVEVIYPRTAMQSLANVLAIPLRAANGAIVRVGDVAHLTLDPAPVVITRTNRADVVHVDATVADGYNLSNVMRSFESNLAGMHLPPNVSVKQSQGGQQELMSQTLKGIGTSLILSVVLVYLLMVALYNDFRDPLIILFAVPVAIVGAVFALWITHQTLNLYSLIGSLLLVGLVTKNGILLVDYANTLRRRDGKNKRDAVVESGATRFRPIIMTTMAMIAGMLPLALALEPGSQSRASLGAVVIGGLSSSLILTLFIVPIMYAWIAPDELSEPLKIGRGRRDEKKSPGDDGGASGKQPQPQPAG